MRNLMIAVFTACCIGLLSLRTIIKIRYIDLDIGFYSVSNAAVTSFNILLFVGMVLMLVLGYRGVYSDFLICKTKGIAACALFAGAGGMLFIHCIGNIAAERRETGALLAASNALDLIGVLSGVCLVAMAVRFFLLYKTIPLTAALIPVAYTLSTLIYRFFSYNTVNSISDHMLEILFYAMCTLLLLQQVRVLCGIGPGRGLKMICALGFMTALSGLTLAFPQLAARSGGTVAVVDLPVIELIFILLISLYALCFAIHTLSLRSMTA